MERPPPALPPDPPRHNARRKPSRARPYNSPSLSRSSTPFPRYPSCGSPPHPSATMPHPSIRLPLGSTTSSQNSSSASLQTIEYPRGSYTEPQRSAIPPLTWPHPTRPIYPAHARGRHPVPGRPCQLPPVRRGRIPARARHVGRLSNDAISDRPLRVACTRPTNRTGTVTRCPNTFN